jgi:MFS family permease
MGRAMSEPGGKTVGSPGPDRRWLVLVTVAIAQLMVVLDATVVNIALPSAQRDLGFANSDRQWVVTAYALAFGGLLLLGGRVVTCSDASGSLSSACSASPGPRRSAARPRRSGCPTR